MQFSLIIPVYNRPQEVDELLESLTQQTFKDFEVIVVEDGSSLTCRDVVKRYEAQLKVFYFIKPNSGPGASRNYGAEYANGDYLIILDSDCIIPPYYLTEVYMELSNNPCDAFGGPDRAHDSFTRMQKAINYGMTSFFTTGGIRGGKKQLDKFYPRSFNMGIRADVFNKLNGFSDMRFGEDIDFSIRLYKAGCKVRLFPKAWVFHKRRVDLRKFYKQVYNSGIARINLYKKYPESLKTVHLLPAVFTVGTLFLVLCSIFCIYSLIPIALYCLLILLDATISNKSFIVGLLAIPAAFTQLFGYGFGFLKAVWQRIIRGRNEFNAFEKNFYK
ncbi:glycosyltransferase [Parabacteroides sp. FAFU027]|uniref:glycosyltransferase n=1 Tax=Parabacteroides sp. FAFU027 TaxID=2922715 RepID=UPI001FAF421F|nr:glycosyltransferase [Parabacteroides sp. FAFU027]